MPAKYGTRPCENCKINMQLKIKRDLNRKRFCSRKCLGIWTSQQHGRKDILKKMHKLANTPEANLKKRNIGKNHPNYKQDRSQIKSKRPRFENTKWTKSVFKRDNYTCQHCHKHGGKLQADHIKPYSLYPELRWNLDNGRTLCIDCHKKTDTYGFKLMWKIKKGKLNAQ